VNDVPTHDQPTDPGTDPGPSDAPIDIPPPQDTAGQTTYVGGVLLAEIDSEFLKTAFAAARFTLAPLPPPDNSFGECSVSFQDPNNPPPAEHGYDAGVITVPALPTDPAFPDTSPPVTLTPVNRGGNGTGYESNLPSDQVDLLPGGGAILTFKAAGGADIGVFEITVQNPEPVSITSPNVSGTGGSASKSSPLTVTWPAGNGDQMIISISPLTSDLLPQAASGNALACVVQDTGSVTIPTAALALISSGNNALGVTRLKTNTGTAQGSTVSASITWSSGGLLTLN
jgi:hypothetical protein